MIEVTGAAQLQAWRERVMPPVEEVRPGLWSIPVPLPHNPLRYVLVYSLECDGGIALVDAGWNTEEAWDVLRAGLDHIGAGVDQVRAVLVTHIHPDHYGLAGRIREASGAWVGLHPADAAVLPGRYEDVDELLTRMSGLMRACGVPALELEELSSASMMIRQLVQITQPDRLLDDGDLVPLGGRELRAVWTPGHSPGHLCFYDANERLLLAGDHVLPRISPNISVHSQQRPNPLAEFMDALRRVRALDVDEVLPAHEYRFRNLASRVDDLLAHHAARLDAIAEMVVARPGITCWEITVALPWSRPWADIPPFMRRAANGETLAHLMVLLAAGRVARHGFEPWRWEPPAL
ncbi:MAG TPA: MBL fold metallo-hydrolase [Candidatus Dormibacteraeota bacterium]|nr:MBL fold metallo-hydrolase [Candidatus Dormibacteraeota bacterium]